MRQGGQWPIAEDCVVFTCTVKKSEVACGRNHKIMILHARMYSTLPLPPVSFPGGGRHLVNPKFFVAAHCVVVWVAVLWGTTTCIPCRTFCSLSLKWNCFGNKLYVTRDIPEGKWVPKNLLAPAKPPTKKAKPPPKSAAQSIPVESGEHVQEFKVKWSRTKKFYTAPVKE